MAEYDPRLVRVVSRAIRVGKGLGHDYDGQAEGALAAINASGIAWIAPWKPSDFSDLMYRGNIYEAWDAFRDACLAES